MQWRQVQNVIAENSRSLGGVQGDLRSVYPSLRETVGIGSRSSANPLASRAPAPLRRDVDTDTTRQGKITAKEMILRLRDLRKFAEEHNLEWRAEISKQGLERMANDPEFRENHMRLIRDGMKAQLEGRSGNNSDSNDGDDDDDDVSSTRSPKDLRAHQDAARPDAFRRGDREDTAISRDPARRSHANSHQPQTILEAQRGSDDSDDSADDGSD